MTRVDVLDLLAYYNIEGIIRGEEFAFSCPFHNDKDPSANFNIITAKWTCFRCKVGGNPIEFVSLLEHWTYRKADLWIQSRYGGFFKPASLSKEVTRKLEIKEDHFYPESALNKYKFKTKYWDNRGISKELQDRYELGFDPRTKRATIPFRDHEGRLLGVQGRATTEDGERYGKYLFILDLPKKQYVFGLNQIDHSSYVVVVESAITAIRLMDMGIPTVSTCGSVVSDEQAEHLNSFDKVYMLFDNDEAGWLGMIGNPERPKSRLAAWKKIVSKVYIPQSEDYDDLDVLEKDSIIEIMNTSKNAHVNIPLVMSRAFSNG